MSRSLRTAAAACLAAGLLSLTPAFTPALATPASAVPATPAVGHAASPTTHVASAVRADAGDWPQPLGATHPYQLVMHDEFDDGWRLDESLWTPQRGYGEGTYGTPFIDRLEQAAFAPENVSVWAGTLRLNAHPGDTTVRTGNGVRTYPYGSGAITSEGKFAMRYGYIETRMWVPDGPEFWPALWMASSSGLDEIDVAEFFTSWDGLFHPFINAHWGSTWGDRHEANMRMVGPEGTAYGRAWHTYGLEWRPGSLRAYVDGVPGPVIEEANIPDDAMYLILNLSVYRDFWPQSEWMEVDYVRVWA